MEGHIQDDGVQGFAGKPSDKHAGGLGQRRQAIYSTSESGAAGVCTARITELSLHTRKKTDRLHRNSRESVPLTWIDAATASRPTPSTPPSSSSSSSSSSASSSSTAAAAAAAAAQQQQQQQQQQQHHHHSQKRCNQLRRCGIDAYSIKTNTINTIIIIIIIIINSSSTSSSSSTTAATTATTTTSPP
ncbi:hypothetical protein, conserved [Eimeria praecox]|uniref:Uncharacterized protein n=1 Tax=Eimeria praecox TaxID=51316 RepID=U6H3M5_9EIME|nr:hypothetical protein, conserved [Eimeria praecox]